MVVLSTNLLHGGAPLNLKCPGPSQGCTGVHGYITDFYVLQNVICFETWRCLEDNLIDLPDDSKWWWSNCLFLLIRIYNELLKNNTVQSMGYFFQGMGVGVGGWAVFTWRNPEILEIINPPICHKHLPDKLVFTHTPGWEMRERVGSTSVPGLTLLAKMYNYQ